MRLTNDEIAKIRAVVRQTLGERARVSVFGSRTDDSARGGDLDLLVEADRALANRAAAASRLEAELQLALGDQKIDVILIDPTVRQGALHASARRGAVAL